MFKRSLLCLFISMGLTVNAQTVNVRGTVSNKAGKPIANAIVSLAKQGLKDTTAADGAFSLSKSTAVELPLLIPQSRNISLERGMLVFCLPNTSPVKVEIFDVLGNLLQKEIVLNAVNGFYRFNVAENTHAAKVLFIRASIGRDAVLFRYLPLRNGACIVDQINASGPSAKEVGLTKIAAINDTLNITAPGYAELAQAITSYNQTLNITLDTVGGGGVGHSPGCGKTPTLTNGAHTIQSSGTTRNYMIRIPANYDNNHPYPLVFAFHWNGGKMNDIDGGGSSGYTWSYYGLREQADSSKNSKMIFVAPDGNGGWPNTNGRDLTLVDDLLKFIEGDLCIDTTRIFSMGFSYGGGMTYAIACARASVFRAAAVYSGAVLSGCTGGTLPIAYIGIHGVSDPTCGIGGGRSLRDKFVANNGCTTQSPSEPKAGSGTHICTKYPGCKAGYPVEWCAFDGGHTPGNVDGGGDDGAKTWTKAEVWKFFTQF